MFKDLKALLTPPFISKDLYSIFIIVFIMVSIPLTVLQVSVEQTPTQINAVAHPSKTKVSILSPTANEEVAGVVNIKLESVSDLLITGVRFNVNGRLFATQNNSLASNSYSASIVWDTRKEMNGEKTLVAEATDNSGFVSRSSSIIVKVNNIDKESPSISFSQPTDGSYVKESESYKVKLNANDNNGISHLIVTIDAALAKNFTSGPYEFDWDVKSLKTGTHILTATVFDLAGNESSTKISVYVGVKGLNL